MEILTDAAVKGAAILIIAGVATWFMRNASAARRHQVWAVAVTVLLLVPVLSLIVPAWRVLPAIAQEDLPTMVDVTAAPELAVPDIRTPTIEAPTLETPSVETPTLNPSVIESPRLALSPISMLLIVWLTGALLVLVSIVAGFARVAWLARSARPFPSSACRNAISAMMPRDARIELLEGEDLAMPMTWGVMRARLLLPRSAHHSTPARLNAVVRHELAHIRRRDPFWQLIGELACAVHWYNPLAWYAARRMRVEREHACDDAVLTAGSRASEYATELLEIARSLRSARATSMAAIAMARPRQLEGRLLAVLDDKRSRGDVRRRWPVWAGALMVVLPLAALEPTVREASATMPTVPNMKPQPKPKPIAKPTTLPVKQASIASAIGIASNAQSPGCLRESVRNISINSNSDDDFKRVKWETRNCKGTMEIYGAVRIAGDLSGFEYIPPGGKVVITAQDEDHKRELTLTPGNDRAFAYIYEVDGARRTWDNDAKEWLSSVVTLLVRRAGFGADERVDYLLRTGGVNAVLQEVAVMESDYTQRMYLTKLLNKTTLNGSAVESVINVAGRTLDSDYELTEFLIAVGRKYDFTPESRAAFIAATQSLQSDYEHRRALSAVLKKGGLSSEDVTAILTSASKIESNYEKAELLIGIAGRYRMDQRMRTAYLNATRGMNSDYEKKRVFTTLLKQGGLDVADLAYLLDATSAVASDYERGEILKLVAANLDFSQPRLQEAYVKAASEIDSDHELRQVLNAVLKRESLSPAALNVVLDAAETINSDYERAELLTQILRSHKLTQDQRQKVIRITDQMRSDYERGRVSSLLIRQMNGQQ